MSKQEVHTGFLWEKAGKQRPLGRLRSRWEDNIKINLKKNEIQGLD
jgi:hypothetical protein